MAWLMDRALNSTQITKTVPSLPLTTTKLFKLFYKEGTKPPWGKAIPSYQSVLQQGENPPVTVNVFQFHSENNHAFIWADKRHS